MPTVATAPLSARFDTICKICKGKIAKGSEIVSVPGTRKAKTWAHVTCLNNPAPVATSSNPEPSAPVTANHETKPVEVTGKAMIEKIIEKFLEEYQLDISDDLKPVNGKIAALSDDVIGHAKDIESLTTEFRSGITSLRTALAAKGTGTFKLEIKVADLPKVELKDAVHPAFEKTLRLAANRKNILLVGPAGTGKTHLANQVADALKLPFYFLSCSAGMSEGHLLGRLLPTGKGGQFVYSPSDTVRAYEEGGVILWDELDAADANTLLVVNSALANGEMSIPNRVDKPVAKRHKNFVCIAAANTVGNGANRQYVGRGQLDESTLDRFRIGQVAVNYDDALEARLCPDETLRTKLQQVRRNVMDHQLRRVVSTRFLMDAFQMQAAGFTHADIYNALTFGWTTDETSKAFLGMTR